MEQAIGKFIRENWVLSACLVFILINALLISQEIFVFMAVPAALLVIWALFTSLDRLVLFVVFATPLSISLEELDLGGIGFYFPTEPIMVAIMLLFIVKVALEKDVLSKTVWRHPVTIAILFNLGWMAFCIIPSEMPLVSFKFLVSRLWFVCTMYFVATRLFEKERYMQRFFWMYLISFVGVIFYTLIHHSMFSFEQDPAHWVMSPFFKDHTSYGASIAMFIPFTIFAIGFPRNSRTMKGIAVFVALVLTAGLIFSFTRAAWVSLAGALAVFLAIKLRIRFWVIALIMISAGGTYVVLEDQILIALERNREESSDDLAEHVQSISNISSDASNLERINRWNSALRMFEERPVFGWGPGTYSFQYAPFQASRDRTIISTNFGTGGNAHSEYLGPLAEMGLIGMLSFLSIVALTMICALRTYKVMDDDTDRRLLLAAMLGLFTYYLHGILNNYLDTDKASVPFWAFTAMVVLFDIKYRNKRSLEATGEHSDVVEGS